MPRWYPSQQLARPIYYDRNAILQGLAFQATGAPHALTLRASYTVPTGKKAFIENLYGERVRLTAAAPASEASVQIQVNIGVSAIMLRVSSQTNTIGTYDQEAQTGIGYLAEGNSLSLYSYDLSTGGTCTLIGTAKITEFDA